MVIQDKKKEYIHSLSIKWHTVNSLTFTSKADNPIEMHGEKETKLTNEDIRYKNKSTDK